MTFEQWEADVPHTIRNDSLWKMEAYRLGLFLSDLAWVDTARLLRERRTVGIADQLFRAVGNISSNIAEGYSRGTGKDRARLYEYALGSIREARDWYYKSRHVLSDNVTTHRLELATSLTRLVIRMVANERKQNRRLIERVSD